MQLTNKEVNSFKNLYKQKFNVELSDNEALKTGLQLINLMKSIILPNLEVGKK